MPPAPPPPPRPPPPPPQKRVTLSVIIMKLIDGFYTEVCLKLRAGIIYRVVLYSVAELLLNLQNKNTKALFSILLHSGQLMSS